MRLASRLSVALAGVVTVLLSTPVVGHHGAAAAFDVTKSITVQGTMTEFLFVHPHVQLYFERKNDKGELEKWQGALTAPSKLSRAGWNKRTLQPGDQVTVSGSPAKNGSNSIWIRKLIGPKGDSLPLFED